MPHFVALFVVLIWGTTFVSSKVLLNSGLLPADIFFVRFVIAYCCMLCISHKRLFANSLADELTLMGLGMMGGSIYFLVENMALLHSTSSNVSILVSTTPLVTAMLLAIFYKSERMSGRQIFGSIIAFIGVVLVVLNGQFILHLNPLGDALALGASFTWGFYSLFMRRIMGRYKTDFITRKVFFYGLVTIMPYFAFVHPLDIDLLASGSMTVWGNLLFLGFVASTGGYLLWNWVMRNLGAMKSTNYIYLQPLISMLAGYVILRERITFMAIAGAAILITGTILAVRKKRSKT
ncbi:MAG: DMT family transporter [Prevotella sp.]|nr:DMT family transporter [Prevotella sp.]